MMFLVYFLSPTVIFTAGNLTFTYLYHRYPTIASLVMCTVYLGALIPAFHRRHRTLAVFCMISAASGHAEGMHNYHGPVHMSRALDDYKVYTNLLPTAPATAHQDAIALEFSLDTKVDATKAIGLKTGMGTFGRTFCVAPIFDASQDERAEYWAAGMDCCEGKAVFTCDDSSDESNHQGIVVRDTETTGVFSYLMGALYTPSLGNRDLFLEAVGMAESAYGMKTSDKPIIVRWLKEDIGTLQAGYEAEIVASLLFQILADGIGNLVFAALFVLYTGGVYDDQKEAAGTPLLSGAPALREVHHIAAELAGTEVTTFEVWGYMCILPFFGVVAPAVIMWTFMYGDILGRALCYFHSGLILAIAIFLVLRLRLGTFGLFTFLMLITGVYIGRMNYFTNTLYYHASADFQTYTNVLASEPAATHQDGGKFSFAPKDSVLDKSQALSYRYHGTDYCVAPVLPSSGSIAEVQYWAAGVNCCAKARGDFTCASAGTDGAMSGNRIRDFKESWLAPRSPMPIYREAAAAAAELAGMQSAADAIFLYWSSDPKEMESEFFGRGVGITILSLLGTALFLVGMSFFAKYYLVPAKPKPLGMQSPGSQRP